MSKTEHVGFHMRFPVDLYRAVQRAAAADNRSMANWLRERALEHPAVKDHMSKQDRELG